MPKGLYPHLDRPAAGGIPHLQHGEALGPDRPERTEAGMAAPEQQMDQRRRQPVAETLVRTERAGIIRTAGIFFPSVRSGRESLQARLRGFLNAGKTGHHSNSGRNLVRGAAFIIKYIRTRRRGPFLVFL